METQEKMPTIAALNLEKPHLQLTLVRPFYLSVLSLQISGLKSVVRRNRAYYGLHRLFHYYALEKEKSVGFKC